MNVLSNYKSSIILLTALIIGGAIGLIMGEKASVLAPLGELLLNLIFTILVPLVFFSISSAIANIGSGKKLSKILGVTIIIFGFTAVVSSIIGTLGYIVFNPTKGLDISSFTSLLSSSEEVVVEQVGVIEKIVLSITVGDFSGLLTRSNMLAIVLISILVGFATFLAGEEGTPFANLLNSGSVVMMKMLSIIMYYAPIGLGCYFATTIGALGGQIATGFAKAFVVYLGITIVYFFAFFTFYAFIAGKKDGVKIFWKNISGPSVTALATCSSAACIPINIESANKMGVSKTLAKIIMPLGVNIHKDGSIIGAVFKILFVMGVLGIDFMNFKTIIMVILLSLLVGAVVGAVPGGGAIGEILILSILGFPPETIALMLVIATIIDAPATLLNSAGNTVCTMMVARFTEGLNFNKEQIVE
ncbi:dicarboxylate/amino acid:cation symporter [Clostridium sp. AL.422]|uniref:dicarboxylate/amino acid:cation symporter n=1 Tax=Clostridium TaxID=1485 RepID=UPI00293DE8C9|nr:MULTISPECIES: dicarboxylate/amino acid:cation symporter [unclassified Clostridium]MDV4150845.1 dicarboxylate/amino acid:cation symporter [Clostridium sp. AL.422]